MNRREFVHRSASSALFLATYDIYQLVQAFPELQATNRLSLLAHRTTRREGTWVLKNIDGKIPADLNGSLFRVGPGQKENYGTNLNHFFDGDSYVWSVLLANGEAKLTSYFINTPEREAEKAAQKMLYHEFGTKCEYRPRGFKYQPNINIVKWNNELLALSESSKPVAITSDFKYIRPHDFFGTLPDKVTFTAHPKFDSVAGDGFAYGIHQGLDLSLKVFRMDSQNGKLKPLYSLRQKKIFLIHDMLMTENYIIFVIPPCYFNLMDMALKRAPMAAAIEFDKTEPTQILVLRKDGKGEPVRLSMPTCMLFHNGNAYEDGNKIVLHSFLADDSSVFEALKNRAGRWPADVKLPALSRFTVDLQNRSVSSVEKLYASADFPAWNLNLSGKKTRYLYFAHLGVPGDYLAFNRIVKYDSATDSFLEFDMPAGTLCGEPIFISHPQAMSEDHGWCVFQTYDSKLDLSYLNILNGQNFALEARVSFDSYYPLGLHGSFARS